MADKEGVIRCLRQAAATETAAGRASWGIALEGYASKIERRRTFDDKLLVLLQPKGEQAPSLKAFETRIATKGLQDIILSPQNEEEIKTLLLEQKNQEQLAAHQLEPRRKILLIGPPGSGKTLLAEILAKETGKTFHILRMGQLMDSLLGNTVRNIENSFAAIAHCDGVFLFDEFDALGSARDDKADVNEMRRALNSILICLENTGGTSLIIAATNHPKTLDKAFRRRFDSILEFHQPSDAERNILIKKTLEEHRFSSPELQAELLKATEGLSFDETKNTTLKTLVDAIIHNKAPDASTAHKQNHTRKKLAGD